MTARAEAAARTGRGILTAAAELWRERPIDQITLADIAERAGVSVRTVIRRFGSREGVIAACIEADASGIVSERDQAAAGDVEGALDVLLAHYERDGDAVLRTLALEEKVAEAKAIADAGRAGHRLWCARVFAPHLPPAKDDAYGTRLDALVAATDLYVWKLLRRDLGRSEDDARQVIRALVDGLLSLPHPPA
ncbi:MAG TPA: helix-turn-helix domain-containing protein [Longimicrobium sp.]|nr:helix-turn-helix domain-containing protein [Longimicrobium sp.]